MITVEVHEGKTRDYIQIDKHPDHCPICHAGIEPVPENSQHFNTTRRTLELVFRCPRSKCQALFIARYGGNAMYGSNLRLMETVPFEPYNEDFSDHIGRISPQFCAIANEAQKAESQGWKLIAGPGYRKALEFLIKDYLCLAQPQDTEEIKKVQLGTCIQAYVKNEKVRAVAARAAWLGNDETHYLRKWEQKDLEDLEALIDLTVHWIEMEEMTASVVKDMPDGKK